MPIIDKKYEELSLKDEHLGDPLLLALAWKKAINISGRLTGMLIILN